ncbi:DNA-processing protein DprA [Bacillus xiapuensis]|uniref:DNA-processing protein DprA n=1 Tax=Bacillus xiapuensis TaxID=2014075 RepID=UPI000C243805|nr:DNA-processing protein DprA [Bacillus xiapuensis]
MKEVAKRIIHLQHCRKIGWKSIFNLLKQDSRLENLYHYSAPQLSSLLNLPITEAASIRHQLHHQSMNAILTEYHNQGISFIPLFSKQYPKLLLTLPQPPWGIYAAGDLSLLQASRKLAIVGARKANEYGARAIQMLMPDLVAHGCVIVSGLAKGIDAMAHREAIKCSGRTIAVIAGGFYHLYPAENKRLASEIIRSHLLLSEYPPCTRPEKWQFPARNRIISGLSLGTVVVQAGKSSGSLITAHCALEQGREVFCVPGMITDPLSAGTNDLLSDGAKLVRSSEDILNEISRE